MSAQPTPSRGVPITLDRVRYLRYPIGALTPDAMKGTTLARILWIGLRGDDPDLTEEQVGDMIDLQTLPELRDALRKATSGVVDLKRFFPMMFESDPPTPTPTAENTGEKNET